MTHRNGRTAPIPLGYSLLVMLRISTAVVRNIQRASDGSDVVSDHARSEGDTEGRSMTKQNPRSQPPHKLSLYQTVLTKLIHVRSMQVDTCCARGRC